jgi:hypothetical protein
VQHKIQQLSEMSEMVNNFSKHFTYLNEVSRLVENTAIPNKQSNWNYYFRPMKLKVTKGASHVKGGMNPSCYQD